MGFSNSYFMKFASPLLFIFISSPSTLARPFSLAPISIRKDSPKNIFERGLGYVDTSCSNGPYSDIFEQARVDAMDIAEAGQEKLNVLLNWLQNEDVDYIPQTSQIKTILETFQAIFGRVYFRGHATKTDAGIVCVEHVRDFLEELSIAAYDQTGEIDYYCSNDWLLDDPPEGTQDTEAKPLNGKWDVRTVHNPKPGWRRNMLAPARAPNRPGWCSSNVATGNPTLQAALFPQGTMSTEADILLFCDNYLASYQANGTSLLDFKSQTFSLNEKHLDDFKGRFTVDGSTPGALAFLVLHETSHSPMSFVKDSTDDFGGYTWSEVTDSGNDAGRSQNYDIPLHNANSYAFFATAMYLDNNDWSDGYSQALPTENLTARWITILPSDSTAGKINPVQNGILLSSSLRQLLNAYNFLINPDDQYKIVYFGRDPFKIAGRRLDEEFIKDSRRPPDELFRCHFRQAVLVNMRGAGEHVFEHDFPPGSDIIGEIRAGTKATERMEFELDDRLAADVDLTL